MTWTAQNQSNINCGLRQTCSAIQLSTKSEVVEDIDTLSQKPMRELTEFRAHCGRAFTQCEEIRHFNGTLKPMAEVTCQVGYEEI